MVTQANYDVPVILDFHLGLEYPFVDSICVHYCNSYGQNVTFCPGSKPPLKQDWKRERGGLVIILFCYTPYQVILSLPHMDQLLVISPLGSSLVDQVYLHPWSNLEFKF